MWILEDPENKMITLIVKQLGLGWEWELVMGTFNYEGVHWQSVLGWCTHPAQKIDQVYSDNNSLRESNMITEKVINDR